MTEYAVSHPISRAELDPNAVLGEAWRLYKRLFTRSVVMGAIVFGVVQLIRQLAEADQKLVSLYFVGSMLAFVGGAVLQGGFVEIVRGLHVDGDDEISVVTAFQRTRGKRFKLMKVSGRSAFCVFFASILFVVPGLVLLTRWAVAVPVAMLEEGSARDALRRSRAIVDGNGWNVFKVLFACWALTLVVTVPLGIVGGGLGPFGRWVAVTLAWALTAPFTAHALIVVYYALVTPGRPVVLEPGRSWESVWTAQDGVEPAQPSATEPRAETLDEEQMRKFEERERQWGG